MVEVKKSLKMRSKKEITKKLDEVIQKYRKSLEGTFLRDHYVSIIFALRWTLNRCCWGDDFGLTKKERREFWGELRGLIEDIKKDGVLIFDKVSPSKKILSKQVKQYIRKKPKRSKTSSFSWGLEYNNKRLQELRKQKPKRSKVKSFKWTEESKEPTRRKKNGTKRNKH